MQCSKKKLAMFCTAGIIVLALACIGAYAFTTSSSTPPILPINASIEEVEDRVKVFIGDIDHAPENYIEHRSEYIEQTAKENKDMVMKAVIGLNDYYSVEDVTVWAKDSNIEISRVYMWPEGETGRLILGIESGSSIQDSIEDYKRQVEIRGMDDEQFKKDYQRFLNGEYGIFALTATAPAETLAELSVSADCVNLVDVMYNDDVEDYAKQVGKTVAYIELPSKPDGVG